MLQRCRVLIAALLAIGCCCCCCTSNAVAASADQYSSSSASSLNRGGDASFAAATTHFSNDEHTPLKFVPLEFWKKNKRQSPSDEPPALTLKELMELWGLKDPTTTIRARRGDIEVIDQTQTAVVPRGDVPESSRRKRRQTVHLPRGMWGYGENDGLLVSADPPSPDESNYPRYEDERRYTENAHHHSHHHHHRYHSVDPEAEAKRLEQQRSEERRRQQWDREAQRLYEDTRRVKAGLIVEPTVDGTPNPVSQDELYAQRMREWYKKKAEHDRALSERNRTSPAGMFKTRPYDPEMHRHMATTPEDSEEDEQTEAPTRDRWNPQEFKGSDRTPRPEEKTANSEYEASLRQWKKAKEEWDRQVREREMSRNKSGTKTQPTDSKGVKGRDRTPKPESVPTTQRPTDRTTQPSDDENEKKLQDYIHKITPIYVDRTPRPPQRRPEELSRRPEDDRRRKLEEERRRQDEHRRRQEEERRLLEEGLKRPSENRSPQKFPGADRKRPGGTKSPEENRRRPEEDAKQPTEVDRRRPEEEKGVMRPGEDGRQPPGGVKRPEQGRKRPEEERRRQEEERRRQEEERRRQEEERRRQEEGRRRQEEEDRRRQEEERRRPQESKRPQVARPEDDGRRRPDEDRRGQPAGPSSKNERVWVQTDPERIEENERLRQLELMKRQREDERRKQAEDQGRRLYDEQRRRHEENWTPGTVRPLDNNLRPDTTVRGPQTPWVYGPRTRPTTEAPRTGADDRYSEFKRNQATSQFPREEDNRPDPYAANAARTTTPAAAAPSSGSSSRFEIDFTTPGGRRGPSNLVRPVKIPTPCDWSVAACCRQFNRGPGDLHRLANCFEATGCPDLNYDPDKRCRPDTVRAADQELRNFFLGMEPRQSARRPLA